MELPHPESSTKTPSPRSRTITVRGVVDTLRWVGTAVNVFALLRENDAASSVIKTIKELAATVLATILGLRN